MMLLKAAESRIELITQGDIDGSGARTVAASCRTTARVRKKVFL